MTAIREAAKVGVRAVGYSVFNSKAGAGTVAGVGVGVVIVAVAVARVNARSVVVGTDYSILSTKKVANLL